MGKATGKALYADDLTFPGMLYGRTVRSTIPRGRVRAIKRNFDADGFTVVDCRDIPGKNVIALIENDQPCLVEHEVRHFAEPILLLAHADRERLLAADVDIDYEPGTPVLDPATSGVVVCRLIKPMSRISSSACGLPSVASASDHAAP